MSSDPSDSPERRTDQERGAASGEPGPQEVYCTSCGSIIKERAEICPECGVRQMGAQQQQAPPAQQSPGGQAGTSERRIQELQDIAAKDKSTVMLVSFLVTPFGYVMIGKIGLAAINFITLNYFLFGFIIVPFHTKGIIESARDELEAEGYSW